MRFVLVQRTLVEVGLGLGLLAIAVGACAEPQSGRDVEDSTGRSVDTFEGGGTGGPAEGGWSGTLGGDTDGTQMVSAGLDESSSADGESSGATPEEEASTDEAADASTGVVEADTDEEGESGSTGDTDAEDGCSSAFTYELVRAEKPTFEQERAYLLIERAMDEALEIYNCAWPDPKSVRFQVYYDPTAASVTEAMITESFVRPILLVPSATSFTTTRVVHELSHFFLGGWAMEEYVEDEVYQGTHGIETLRMLTGDPEAVLYSDGFEFWPLGLQSDDEIESEQDVLDHVAMVLAIYADLTGA